MLLSISQISNLIDDLNFLDYEELALVLLALLRQVEPRVLVFLHPAVAHAHVVTVVMFVREETTQTVGQQGDQQAG